MRGGAVWSARRAHNPKVGGSNPPPATKKHQVSRLQVADLFSFLKQSGWKVAGFAAFHRCHLTLIKTRRTCSPAIPTCSDLEQVRIATSRNLLQFAKSANC